MNELGVPMVSNAWVGLSFHPWVLWCARDPLFALERIAGAPKHPGPETVTDHQSFMATPGLELRIEQKEE